jgi:hypothetical protein
MVVAHIIFFFFLSCRLACGGLLGAVDGAKQANGGSFVIKHHVLSFFRTCLTTNLSCLVSMTVCIPETKLLNGSALHPSEWLCRIYKVDTM